MANEENEAAILTEEERCRLSIEILEGIKDNYVEGFGCPMPEYYAIQCAIQALELMPKKIGRWAVLHTEGYCCYYCSKCGLFREVEERTPFCPNCGAKMAENCADINPMEIKSHKAIQDSISLNVVLQEIRQDIDKWHHLTDKAFNDGIDTALEIIDAHIKEIEK